MSGFVFFLSIFSGGDPMTKQEIANLNKRCLERKKDLRHFDINIIVLLFFLLWLVAEACK